MPMLQLGYNTKPIYLAIYTPVCVCERQSVFVLGKSELRVFCARCTLVAMKLSYASCGLFEFCPDRERERESETNYLVSGACMLWILL